MKLLAATLLAASMVSYTYANRCLPPLVNKGDCMAYSKKKFVSAACDSKAAKKLSLVTSSGKLCAGPRCLIKKVNKKGKVKVSMSKKNSKNAVLFDYNHADNQLTVRAPNDIKGKYPVFEKNTIRFTGKAGELKCWVPPTTEAPEQEGKITWKHIPGRADITQTGPNKVVVKKSDGEYPKMIYTSILFDKKVSYYTVEIVSNVRFMTFGFGLRDHIEYEQWEFDAQLKNWKNGVINLGFRTGTVAYFAQDIEIKDINKGSTPTAFIQNALDGKKFGTASRNKKIISIGGIAKCEANDTFVAFYIDGVEIYKYFFKTGENTDIYPVMDLHHPGDEYILTFYE